MKRFLLLLMISTSLFALEEADLSWDSAGPSVQEYNSALQQAIASKDWWAAIDFAEIISYNFAASPFAQETSFIIGQAYFNLNQLEYANDAFTAYLNHSSMPRHFEEAIQYKFMIAEQFANGVKKRLFNSSKMPAWVPAEEDAIPIYEEVIAALPHSEIAAQALLHKARIQAGMEDYKPSLESLDVLIRRFPKNDFAAEGYLEKTKVYLLQCKNQSPDPALLDLAEVNLRKFRLAFPRQERLTQANQIFEEMQEIFAQHLLQTGKYYQKTKKASAAQLYYNKVISSYPNTKAAGIAKEALLDY